MEQDLRSNPTGLTPGLTPRTQKLLEESRFNQMLLAHGDAQLNLVFQGRPIEHREAFALGIINETDPIVGILQGSFRDGKPYDAAEMPRTGDPAATKITTTPIPQTCWVVRQYPIDLRGPPHFTERQAFLYDLYDSGEGKQLQELPQGYSFESVSIPPTGGSLQLVPVTLSSPFFTTAGIRGVMFAVKHNGVTLLEFTAPFSLFQSTTMNRPPSPPIPTMSHRAPTTKRVTPGLTPLTQHRLEQSRFAQMARELGEDQVDQVFEDYPIEQREAFALGLIDSTDPLVEMLQGSFRDGKPFDIAEMPRTGDPAATKITTIPIPQTRWVVRQFPIDIHSPAEAAERQAFLYDLYDSSEGKQLHELPHGYSFESVSIPPTGGSLQLVPVTLSSPYYTTAGIRGVMFAVKHNRVTLLEFTAPF